MADMNGGSSRRTKPDEVTLESFLVHGPHYTEKWDFRHHIIPPQSSSVAYRLDDTARGARGFEECLGDSADGVPVYIYDRLNEPTRGILEDEFACVEGGEFCVCFSTGMAAISAGLGAVLKAGDHLVTHQALYGCTYSLLTNWYPRLAIDVDMVNMCDVAAVEQALTDRTRAVYFETPVNPTLEIIDIAAVRTLVDKLNAQRSEEERIWVVVDNTFATPYCQRPLSLGADIVVQSLTKNVGGFGTDMGGAVVGPRQIQRQVLLYRKDFGAALAPKSAWPILVYGLPTLPLRLKKQMVTAYEVARFLRSHPKVARVRYPGLEDHPHHALAKRQMRDPDGNFAPGPIIYFETTEPDPGDPTHNCVKVVDWIAKHAYSITLAVSLGQLRTLIENPGAMTHSALPAEARQRSGIAANGVRLAIGVETAADVIRDLERGLSHAD